MAELLVEGNSRVLWLLGHVGGAHVWSPYCRNKIEWVGQEQRQVSFAMFQGHTVQAPVTMPIGELSAPNWQKGISSRSPGTPEAQQKQRAEEPEQPTCTSATVLPSRSKMCTFCTVPYVEKICRAAQQCRGRGKAACRAGT